MKLGFTTFGVIVLLIGSALLFMGNFDVSMQRTPTGETDDQIAGIPIGLAWFTLLAGAVITVAGLVYDSTQVKQRR